MVGTVDGGGGVVTNLAPSFLITKGKRETKIERFTLTTSCYYTEDIPVAQGEAQLFLELMPEKNLARGETACGVVQDVLNSVLT